MKARSVAGAAISAVLAMGATASAQENPFDAVFAIMTQQRGPDSQGCRGCHIVEDPSMAIGDYFGNTQDEVEDTFIMYQDGILIAGGRNSILATFLREGQMPLGGTRWCDADLELLYAWLDTVAPSGPVVAAQ
jgi:hypothetical protein